METPEPADCSAAPEENRVRPTKLAGALGISVPYASQLLGGTRVPPQALALRIWRTAGVKLGPLANLTDDECAQLERLTCAVREVATNPIAMMGEGFAG